MWYSGGRQMDEFYILGLGLYIDYWFYIKGFLSE